MYTITLQKVVLNFPVLHMAYEICHLVCKRSVSNLGQISQPMFCAKKCILRFKWPVPVIHKAISEERSKLNLLCNFERYQLDLAQVGLRKLHESQLNFGH